MPRPGRGERSARGAARRHAGKPAHDQALTTRSWTDRPRHLTEDLRAEVTLECGWGRLIFGQTFAEPRRDPARDRRGGARPARHLHVRPRPARAGGAGAAGAVHRPEPHLPPVAAPVPTLVAADAGVTVRDVRDERDADEINRLYAAAGMVTAPTDVLWANQRTKTFVYLVAEDRETGDILGTVTGIDHRRAFDDPEQGTSLWCLAVDAQAAAPRRRGGAGPDPRRAVQGPRAGLPRPVRGPRQRARHPALRQARVRAGPGVRREAQEPHQRALLLRVAGRRPRPAEPLRADRRGRGAAARDHRARARRRRWLPRAQPRWPHRHHARVAVGAHDRGGDVDVRRQARHPPASWRGAASASRGAAPPPSTTADVAFLEEVGRARRQARPWRAGPGHHGRGHRRRRAGGGAPAGPAVLPRRAARGAGRGPGPAGARHRR